LVCDLQKRRRMNDDDDVLELGKNGNKHKAAPHADEPETFGEK